MLVLILFIIFFCDISCSVDSESQLTGKCIENLKNELHSVLERTDCFVVKNTFYEIDSEKVSVYIMNIPTLTYIPNSLSCFSNLNNVSISNCGIISCDCETINATNLFIHNNNIMNLSNLKCLPKDLKKLDLSGNKFRKTIDITTLPSNLVSLDISFNNISKIHLSKDKIFNQLSIINISATDIDTLELTKYNFPKLKQVVKYKGLPPVLGIELKSQLDTIVISPDFRNNKQIESMYQGIVLEFGRSREN